MYAFKEGGSGEGGSNSESNSNLRDNQPKRKPLIQGDNISSNNKGKISSSSSSSSRIGPDSKYKIGLGSDRPFSLPPGQFKPKQSLGQNFLSDQNYVLKIVDALHDDSEKGVQVVELGPGPGALSRVLIERYPKMTAVEIDQRAVAFLAEKLPGLKVSSSLVLYLPFPSLPAYSSPLLPIPFPPCR